MFLRRVHGLREFDEFGVRGRRPPFPLTAYIRSLFARGRTVTRYARWRLEACGEIPPPELPLARPGALAAVNPERQATETPPPEPKQAPLNMEFALSLDHTAANPDRRMGVRVLASAVMLMVLASLRHSDTCAAYDLWVTKTAVFGSSRDLEKMGAPNYCSGAPFAG